MKLSKRQKRVVFVGVVLVGVAGLGFGLGELYVRVRYPAYGDLWGAIRSHPVWVRELRPGVEGRMRALTGEYDHGYRIDARGFRAPSAEGVKQGWRGVAVGDSNTFGLGVEDEDVWVARLEGEWVNAGWASGYSPDTACLFLEARLGALDADLVVQQITPDNDLADLARRNHWVVGEDGRLEAVRHAYDAVPDVIQALALPRFLALQVVPTLRGRGQGGGGGGGGPADPTRLTKVEREGLERLRVVLERERAFVEGQGLRWVVLLFPTHVPRGRAEDAPGVQHRLARRAAIRELLDALGATVWEPGAAFAAVEEPFFEDGHLRAEGHAALAEDLRELLELAALAE